MSHEDDFQEPELPQALLPPGFLKDPVHLLAFGLGSGAMARAPGTWGSRKCLGYLCAKLMRWGSVAVLGAAGFFVQLVSTLV